MNEQSTTKRILCLWLPNWPIQRIAVAQPELKSQLVTLYRQDPRRGQLVVACSAAASRSGIKIGMLLSEAKSLAKQQELNAPASSPQHRNTHQSLSKTVSSRSPNRAVQSDPPKAPQSFFIHHDPERDLEVLESLADECEIFSPIAGLEQTEQPTCIYLDITGLKKLFQGETNLAEQIIEHFSRLGYWPCVSIAHTIGLAWGLQNEAFRKKLPRPDSANHSNLNASQAASSHRIAIFPEVRHWHDTIQHPEFVSLPVNCLRVPNSTISTLHQLGISRMHQLLQLPRAGLVTRLGEGLIRRLDQATGRLDEVIVARHKPPEFRTELLLDHPTSHPETIHTIIFQETARVCADLQQKQQGALQVHCRLLCDSENQQNIDHEKRQLVSIRIGLFQPTAIAEHLMELMQMQLEQLHLPGGVHEVLITVPQNARLVQKQKHLFDDNPRDNPIALAQLINRLSVRLGEEQVLGFSLCSGAQPEFGFQYHRLASRLKRKRPLMEEFALPKKQKAKRKNNSVAIKSPFQETHFAAQDEQNRKPWEQSRPLDRPLRLLTQPAPLQVFSVTDGPPAFFWWRGSRQEITTCWGPERIQTGWWRGPMAERDYWRIETKAGTRFWIFRELRKKQWYLHGTF